MTRSNLPMPVTAVIQICKPYRHLAFSQYINARLIPDRVFDTLAKAVKKKTVLPANPRYECNLKLFTSFDDGFRLGRKSVLH